MKRDTVPRSETPGCLFRCRALFHGGRSGLPATWARTFRPADV